MKSISALHIATLALVAAMLLSTSTTAVFAQDDGTKLYLPAMTQQTDETEFWYPHI